MLSGTLHEIFAELPVPDPVTPRGDVGTLAGVTAKWSGLSYVVAYLLNGGSGTAPTQADVSHGQSFMTAAAPTRNGFTFSGWSDGATVINASTSVTNVTSNKTLTAQWAIAAPGISGCI